MAIEIDELRPAFDRAVSRSLPATAVWGLHMETAVGKEKGKGLVPEIVLCIHNWRYNMFLIFLCLSASLRLPVFEPRIMFK